MVFVRKSIETRYGITAKPKKEEEEGKADLMEE